MAFPITCHLSSYLCLVSAYCIVPDRSKLGLRAVPVPAWGAVTRVWLISESQWSFQKDNPVAHFKTCMEKRSLVLLCHVLFSCFALLHYALRTSMGIPHSKVSATPARVLLATELLQVKGKQTAAVPWSCRRRLQLSCGIYAQNIFSVLPLCCEPYGSILWMTFRPLKVSQTAQRGCLLSYIWKHWHLVTVWSEMTTEKSWRACKVSMPLKGLEILKRPLAVIAIFHTPSAPQPMCRHCCCHCEQAAWMLKHI